MHSASRRLVIIAAVAALLGLVCLENRAQGVECRAASAEPAWFGIRPGNC